MSTVVYKALLLKLKNPVFTHIVSNFSQNECPSAKQNVNFIYFVLRTVVTNIFVIFTSASPVEGLN